MSGTDSQKLWSGRFNAATDELMERFNASIGFDRKLLEADVAGSVVYAQALHKAGVLDAGEVKRLIEGLQQVRQEIGAPGCELGPELEDIHMAVETRLTQIVGTLGGKLHTGRSRNDQIATDIRLWLRDAVDALVAELGGSFSAEHGIGIYKLGSMARHKNPVALDVMRAIKGALDPKGILNPGRMVEGV